MFDRKIHLFTLLGFKVGIDLTWLILAFLIAWTLAEGLFPYYYEDLTTGAYWAMGIAGAIGLFVSIVFHEFCHSLVARKVGLPMKGITLFLFGGIAEMSQEPEKPGHEFSMAVVGPLSSVLLGAVFGECAWLSGRLNWPIAVTGVLSYLMWLNWVLALFNLIPAFPLDGGRIFRSILWKIKGDLKWSTRVASALGSGFGMALIILGVLVFVGGNFISGVWYFLIGLFIRNASRMSYQQLLIRKALSGEYIERFMNENPIPIPAEETVQSLIENYFYKFHHKMFPVIQDGRLVGCVTSRQVKELPAEQRASRKVVDIARPCTDENTVSPQTDAMKALSLMNRTGNSRLLVVENDHLKGILTLKDLLSFLALKIDLEEEEQIAVPPQMRT